MAVTAQMVKELREMTGAGMMDCKKALVEVDGNLEAAVDYLKEKGLAKAAKKAGRVAAEGLVPQDAESRRLIESIRYQEHVSSRKLQKYACTVSKKECEELMKQGVLNDYGRGIWCLTNENYYNQETGIRIELTDYIL